MIKGEACQNVLPSTVAKCWYPLLSNVQFQEQGITIDRVNGGIYDAETVEGIEIPLAELNQGILFVIRRIQSYEHFQEN